jgi:hypothetical protein
LKTTSIEEAIVQARSDLQYIADAVASTRASGTLGADSYKFFSESLPLSAQLHHASDLLSVRAVALAAVQNLRSKTSPDDPTKFAYHDMRVSWKVGRYLTVQSYVATTWALYDSISKVAGILCCTDDKAKNHLKPVKLPEDLIRGKDVVGARVRDHVKGAYAWPIALSYAVRNWFVHDGHAHNGVDLFKFDGSEPAPFELSDDAWQLILSKCTSDYSAQNTQTRLSTPPDIRSHLIDGLETCHAEIDEVMSFVLLWSTGSIKSQVNLLFGRDSTGSTPIAPAIASTLPPPPPPSAPTATPRL